jgi:hypothetical protein
MINTNMMIVSGASLFQNTGSSLMMISPQTEKIRIESLAGRIKEYLVGKESIRISDLVINFNESADKIVNAIKILKDKGYIEEVN